MMRIARRMQAIAPFRVMAILARARAMEAQGRDIVHMEIGEPDFVSPQPVIDAAQASLQSGQTHYTPAAGLPALRAAIAGYYRQRFGVEVDAQRIIVTPGASGALQLVLGVLVDPGERVLVTDPGYPCNRHMIGLYGGVPVALPVSAADGFAVMPDALDRALDDGVRGLMLASPANPTGNTVDLEQMRELNARLSAVPDAVLICDEIYQGLQYDSEPQTALTLGYDNLVVINSFSKFFGMTGWRVGWLVAPEALTEPMERLAQNIFLAAPTTAQYAALAAFSAPSMEILEQRRQVFQRRRDFLYTAVRELGLDVDKKPSGAFYLYADVSRFTDDSAKFSQDLLEHAGVAITPGLDFGSHRAQQFVRFAYTTGLDRLEQGAERLRRFLRAGS
jgi:aspartate/methionine/tyrosine aminotransferase